MLFVRTDGEGGREGVLHISPGLRRPSPWIHCRPLRRRRRRSSLDPPTRRTRTADGGKGAEPLFVVWYTQEYDFVATVVIDSSSARSSPEAFVKEDEGVTYYVASRAVTSLLRCCLLLSDHQSPESFCHCTVASVPLPPSLLCVKGAVFSEGSRISCSRASRAEPAAAAAPAPDLPDLRRV